MIKTCVLLLSGCVFLSVLTPFALRADAAASRPVVSEAEGQAAGVTGPADPTVPIWVWPVGLFVFCFLLGLVTVMAGIGGGVLYVPLVSSLTPFHVDFVRATGLLMTLAGALAAGPGLLRRDLASLRLMLPCALMASIGGFFGAEVGLALPQGAVRIALGFCLLAAVGLILLARRAETPLVSEADWLSRAMHIQGNYREPFDGTLVRWQIHRTPLGLLLFVVIGFVAGLSGLGAGWANVPVLNLVMGVPLKLAVGTSVFMLSVSNATAAWVYLNRGAWLPLLAIPSVLGLMLGTGLGVRIMSRTRPRTIRYVVIAAMFAAAVLSFLKGLEIIP